MGDSFSDPDETIQERYADALQSLVAEFAGDRSAMSRLRFRGRRLMLRYRILGLRNVTGWW